MVIIIIIIIIICEYSILQDIENYKIDDYKVQLRVFLWHSFCPVHNIIYISISLISSTFNSLNGFKGVGHLLLIVPVLYIGPDYSDLRQEKDKGKMGSFSISSILKWTH